jgi:uncharacterized membrane protein
VAYRFDGSDDNVEFASAPFTGYLFGAVTMAVFLKRNSISTNDMLLYFSNAGGSDRTNLRLKSSNVLSLERIGGGPADSTATVTDTTKWYLLVATVAAGTSTPRFHIHDGTSWTHQNGSNTIGDTTAGAMVGTDKLFFSQPYSSIAAGADLVCAGIKKADSTDGQVETLSRTAFQSWRSFGFDWLIGFDSSLESAGILQDQATPGTGDEVAITGTTAVSDPPGWAWVSTITPVADFTGTPLTGSVPLSVAFTDTSTNTPTSWAWDFGDGTTSTSQNPSHSYAAGGTYTVAMTATNAAGSNTRTRTGYLTATETIAYVTGGGVTIW